MGHGLFLLQYRRMVLAIWGGYCLLVGQTYQQVSDYLVEEVVVALVQMVQGLVLVALGLAWVLLLGVAVLGLGFLRGLEVLVPRFLLGLGCVLCFVSGLVLDFCLHC